MPNKPALPPPVPLGDFLDRMLDLQIEIGKRYRKFPEPDRSIMKASFAFLSDLVQAGSEDELHQAAQSITKLTDAVKNQTKKIKDLKANLEAIQKMAGQAQEILNAILPVVQYL